MLAAYLMKQRQAQSPMGMFAQNFQAGIGPNGGEDVWGMIGDFLNGRARKGKLDKMNPGEAKSWSAPDEGNTVTDSMWGQYSP